MPTQAQLTQSDAPKTVLSMMIFLARYIPLNLRFTSYEALRQWALDFVREQSAPAPVRADVEQDAIRAAAQMWAALEEAGGADAIANHGPVLLDMAQREHQTFKRARGVARYRELIAARSATNTADVAPIDPTSPYYSADPAEQAEINEAVRQQEIYVADLIAANGGHATVSPDRVRRWRQEAAEKFNLPRFKRFNAAMGRAS